MTAPDIADEAKKYTFPEQRQQVKPATLVHLYSNAGQQSLVSNCANASNLICTSQTSRLSNRRPSETASYFQICGVVPAIRDGERSNQRCAKISRVGGSLRDVQVLAGHKALSTTQRYIEADAAAQKKVVDLI